jgi:hypothetical protein
MITGSGERGGSSEWTLARYVSGQGNCPVQEFLNGLTGRHRDEAFALLGRLRTEGSALRPPRSERLETGLFELRGHQVRIFYMFRPGRRIVLLDGIVKKQDKIPVDVLRRVRQYKRQIEALEDPEKGAGP